MRHDAFTLGLDFMMESKRYRVTDIGARTIVAICVSGPHRRARASLKKRGSEITYTDYTRAEAEARGDFNGPPYGVVEHVLDEDDQNLCVPIADYLLDPEHIDD